MKKYCLILLLGSSLVFAKIDSINNSSSALAISRHMPAFIDKLTDNAIQYDLFKQKNNKVVYDTHKDFLAQRVNYLCRDGRVFDSNNPCRDKYVSVLFNDLKITSMLAPQTYNQQQQKIANNFIRNMINPFPAAELSELMTGNYKLNSEHSRQLLAERLAQQTQLSTARYSLSTMLANRLPLTELSANQEQTPQTKLSINQIMSNETSRFTDAAWHKQIEQQTTEPLLQEIAKMEAFRLWLEYHKYQQNERIETLLATLVTQQVNLDRKVSDGMFEYAKFKENLLNEFKNIPK